LLQTDAIQNSISRINTRHLEFEAMIKNHPKVSTTRVLGVIFALEIKTSGDQSYYGSIRNTLYNFFIENGVIMRPVGNIVYILPPYIMTDNQLYKVYEVITNALEIV